MINNTIEYIYCDIKEYVKLIKYEAFNIERQKIKISNLKKEGYETIYEEKVLSQLYNKINKLEYQLYKSIRNLYASNQFEEKHNKESAI